MSSPASATFLSTWRNHARRKPIVLALIELTTPSAVTLRVATREVTTPDGATWEQGLRAASLRERVEQLGPGLSPADGSVVLANRLYPFMTSGTVDATLADYQWQGGHVTLYLWDDQRTSAGTQVLAWADALCVLDAARIDSFRLTDDGLELTLLQDQSWNNRVPATVVDKISYPNAPEVAQGQPVPIIYGDFAALPMRSPWTTSYGSKQYQEDAGGGQGVVPGLLVDPGLGAANVKVVYASHLLGDLLDRANGYTQFIVGNDVLSPLDTTGITESLGASESYITINDDTLIAYYGVRGLEPRTTYNTADNARRAADVFDETSYATIDQGAGKSVVELTLPSVGSLGYIEAVDVYCAFSGDPANANTFRVRPQVPGGASGTAITSTLGQAQSATPVIISGTWDATYAGGQTWQFGGTASGTPVDIKCEFTGGAANKARVYWAVVRVKYRPQRNLVTPAYWDSRISPPSNLNPSAQSLYYPFLAGQPTQFRPAQLQSASQFFANLKGYKDDGSGTYTGTASALIQRPCDIAQHFLVTYGALSTGDIETGAATFGSFVAARDSLRNAAPTDFKLACWIGQKTSVQQVLREIAAQSLGCILLDRFSGKWLFHVWRKGPAADYDLAFERTDVPDLFECGVLSDVGLAQGIRVRWAYDYFKNRTLFETFVNAGGSSQGYALPTTRDQILTVATGVNDKLDIYDNDAATENHLTLTAGTYAPIDLASHIQGLIRAIGGFMANFRVLYGFTIKAGLNDKLDIHVGAANYTGTLSAGDYTADELCTEAVRALNASGSGLTFAVTYAQSTNKFTVSATGGTFWVYEGTGPNRATSGWDSMGWYSDSAGAAASQTSEAIYCERFVFSSSNSHTHALRWATGTNSATCCAELLGASKLANSSTATLNRISLARNQRETLCAASEAAFGPRADAEVVAPWVRDESSAQRLRDGLFDFGSTPPVWVRFRSHACPDLQLMRVIQFTSDMDRRRPYPGYGTDGSWANKAFRVLEINHELTPSFHSEVYALEA